MIRRRRRRPISVDRSRFNQPAGFRGSPLAFAVTAFGIKSPGFELLSQWIPANPLAHFDNFLVGPANRNLRRALQT